MKRVFKDPAIIEVCFRDGRYRHYELNAIEERLNVLTLYLSNGSVIQIAPCDWSYYRRVRGVMK